MITKTNQMQLNIEDEIQNTKYYCAFSYLFVNPFFKAKIFEYFDYDIKRAWNADKKDIELAAQFYNISIPRSYFEKKLAIDVEKSYENAFLDKEVKILTFEDEKYPPLLKQIPDFPLSLYYKGDIERINNECNLAVVGSRKASFEAKNALDSILSNLKNTNITIVSGLAYGIDAKAHESAIKNNLTTIGVIGSGLDITYPIQNKYLYRDIIENCGVVFSEYPLKTRPNAQNFPQRNRIVVGMSKGTLVAEARIKSGAMISANLTLDYNRELMCIPGNILNPNTSGIYHLIKNGAGIVVNSLDLLNQTGWDIILKEDKTNIKLNDTQEKIIGSLSLEAKTFDEISYETGIETSNLMVALTELELKSLIKQSSNKYYRL